LATQELIAEAGQCHRLAAALPRYCAKIPLYLPWLDAAACSDPLLAPQQLGSFPFITKQDIRRNFPQNFLGTEGNLDDLLEREILELEHTSGTSEQRTALLLPKGWWAQQETRALNLNPVVAALLQEYPEPRRVTLSSPVCSGDVCYTGVPSRNERIVGNTLFLSLSRYPFLWRESDLARMTAETLEWAPLFLDLDPVYGVVFARYCEQHGVRFPSVRFVICSYEFLSIVHRRILERVFRVPVFNLYGSTETGHLLMEDGRGNMRASLETAFLELIEPGCDRFPATPAASFQGAGELIVTTLTNEFMPLVRYRIGDIVECRPGTSCTSYAVHGRVINSFLGPESRRVTTREVDQCFDAIDGIAHYQLIQRGEGPWRLRFVPDRAAPAPRDLRTLQDRLREVLSLAEPPALEAADAILPESSGKFRLGYPSSAATPERQGQPGSPSRETGEACISAPGG
jgi:phenylacetate-coenzyme A ligase PaaK-like adenylate-forming protein